MAITKIKLKQLEASASPGAIVGSDTSNNFSVVNPSTGVNHLWGYETGTTATLPILIGGNLSYDAPTNTLSASAGAGGYTEIQEEGSVVGAANTKINFIGSGLTAANAGAAVTSVTVAAFLNTLATAGNVNLTSAVAGVLPVANGGTNLSAGTSGGILGYTAAGTIASSALLTANAIVLGGGAGALPSTPLGLGTTSTVLHGNAAGAPTWGAVSLTADVTGTLPATNGGTGQASYAVGDLLSANTTTTLSRIAAVGVGSVLKSAGTTTLPVWGTLASTDLSNTANIALLSANQTFAGNNTFSNNITMNGTPSASTDVVTVGYVTNIVANGLKYHSVRGASTAAVTISGRTSTTLTVGGTTFIVDGVTYVNGDYFLLKDNATGAGGGSFDNGAYLVSGVGSSILLTRATYMDAATEIDGHTFIVEDGTLNVGTIYATVSEVTTLGTDAIVFTQIQTSGTVTGTGVNNQISIWSGTNTQDGSSTFLWDGTQFTVGTATAETSSTATIRGTGTSDATYALTLEDSTGANKFQFTDGGKIYFGSGAVSMSSTQLLSNSTYSITTTGLTLAGTGTTSSAGHITISGSKTLTTNSKSVDITTTFTPSGIGTGTYSNVSINGAIDQSAGHTGITRGAHIINTLTSVSDYRGLEITSNASHYALWTTAGKVRFDIGSDATGDTWYRGASGEITRLAAGATSGHVLTSNGSGAAPSWQATAAATAVTRAYLTGSTSSVISLNSGTAVTDVDGANIAFSVPTDLDKTFVVRNGTALSRSGTVSRDYTLVSATGVLTLASALTTDESLLVYKIV